MRRVRWDNERISGVLRLAAAATVVAAIWLVLLPQAGKQTAIREYIAHNEARGIDPSAKFYSELPGMTSIWTKIKDAQRRDEKAFW